MASLPKRFPDRVDIASVRAEAEPLEPGRRGPRSGESPVASWPGAGTASSSSSTWSTAPAASSSWSTRAGPGRSTSTSVTSSEPPASRPRPGAASPSLAVDELQLLAKIKAPLPDTFHGMTDVEQRYRRRYLDLLMNEETRADFEIRTRAVTAIRRYLDENGFLEVETPMLQPRYGGAFAEPFVTHSN